MDTSGNWIHIFAAAVDIYKLSRGFRIFTVNQEAKEEKRITSSSRDFCRLFCCSCCCCLSSNRQWMMRREVQKGIEWEWESINSKPITWMECIILNWIGKLIGMDTRRTKLFIQLKSIIVWTTEDETLRTVKPEKFTCWAELNKSSLAFTLRCSRRWSFMTRDSLRSFNIDIARNENWFAPLCSNRPSHFP